jgi:hypothetical protein
MLHPKKMKSLNQYLQEDVYQPCIPFIWIFLDRLGPLKKKYRLSSFPIKDNGKIDSIKIKHNE